VNRLQEEYGAVAHFLCVYIAEAHAVDEWPLGKIVCLKQPKTMEERLRVAREFKEKYDLRLPLLVDKMDNNFDAKYASWPERFYVIENGRMELIGMPTTEFGYDREDVRSWLAYRATPRRTQFASTD